MKKISWTDSVRNEVLKRVKEEWNILQKGKKRKKKKGRLTLWITVFVGTAF